MRASRLAAAPFPAGLDVDALLFAVLARPADVVRPVVHPYELNQVAAGLVAALARVHGALFRPSEVAYGSFSHKSFYRRVIKAINRPVE
jgi:predicted ATPase